MVDFLGDDVGKHTDGKERTSKGEKINIERVRDRPCLVPDAKKQYKLLLRFNPLDWCIDQRF